MYLKSSALTSVVYVAIGAIVFLMCSDVPAADPMTEFLEKLVVYEQKQLKLAETRMDLEGRLLKFAQLGRKEGDDIIVEIQGLTSANAQKERVARYAQQVNDRKRVIDGAQAALAKSDRTQDGRVVASNFLASKEVRTAQIDSKSCLSSLERMKEASRAISLESQSMARVDEVRSKMEAASAGASASPLEALAQVDANFECERSILEAKYDSWIQPPNMAKCFSAIALNQEKISGPLVLDSHRSTQIMMDYGSMLSPDAIDLKRYESGHEAELVDFIMQQPTASVTPADVFRKSLALVKGDLYVALRMAFGVLRANRTNLELQRKLIDLRGDRASGGRNGGDWYHFFGSMLVRQIYWNWVVNLALQHDNPSNDDKKKYTNSAGVATWEALIKGLKDNRASSELEKDLCRVDQQIGVRDTSVPIVNTLMRPLAPRGQSTTK